MDNVLIESYGMSLKKIESIEKLGVFTNYNWACVKEFDSQNILFGFNGSGKTTLSSLFNLVNTTKRFSNEKKSELFDDLKREGGGKFKVTRTDNQHLAYPPTKDQNNFPIYVFNSNFIADHVFDGQQGRIQKFDVLDTTLENPEIVAIDSLIKDQSEREQKILEDQKSVQENFEKLKKEYSEKFRKVFPAKKLVIGTSIPIEDYLPNTTKDELLKNINGKVKEYTLAQKQAQLSSDIQELEITKFSSLSFDFDAFSGLLLQTAKDKALSSLKAKIEKFQDEVEEVDRNEIEPWFNLGQQLLAHVNQEEHKHCPICNTDITSSIEFLLTDFGNHFDKGYEELKTDLSQYQIRINDLTEKADQNQLNINTVRKLINTYKDHFPQDYIFPDPVSIKKTVKKLVSYLEAKKGDSSKPIPHDLREIIIELDNYNKYIQSLEEIRLSAILILKRKTVDPAKCEQEIREAYTGLVCLDLDRGAQKRVSHYHSLNLKLTDTKKEIANLNNQKAEKLKNLKTEARKVGEYLVKLGISHFSIDLNEENQTENILIKYKDENDYRRRLRNTLSEGEKTALAFAYFLSKVSVEVQDIKQVIIVLDDPISSLDDNRLYNTAYLIGKEFKECKQLFVLSHNLLFLKYLNPQLHNNKKASFIISKGTIRDLPDSLRNFQSPYFYLLESVIAFQADNNPNKYEQARRYLPNYIRRVLETYLSFKYARLSIEKKPNQSPGLTDFMNIIEFDKLPDMVVGEITKGNIKDKLSNINKICDSFSHGSTQNFNENNFLSDEALQELAKDTVNIIEYFDGIHFQNIQKLTKTKPSNDDTKLIKAKKS